jgi:hypothetical protein
VIFGRIFVWFLIREFTLVFHEILFESVRLLDLVFTTLWLKFQPDPSSVDRVIWVRSIPPFFFSVPLPPGTLGRGEQTDAATCRTVREPAAPARRAAAQARRLGEQRGSQAASTGDGCVRASACSCCLGEARARHAAHGPGRELALAGTGQLRHRVLQVGAEMVWEKSTIIWLVTGD